MSSTVPTLQASTKAFLKRRARSSSSVRRTDPKSSKHLNTKFTGIHVGCQQPWPGSKATSNPWDHDDSTDVKIAKNLWISMDIIWFSSSASGHLRYCGMVCWESYCCSICDILKTSSKTWSTLSQVLFSSWFHGDASRLDRVIVILANSLDCHVFVIWVIFCPHHILTCSAFHRESTEDILMQTVSSCHLATKLKDLSVGQGNRICSQPEYAWLPKATQFI